METKRAISKKTFCIILMIFMCFSLKSEEIKKETKFIWFCDSINMIRVKQTIDTVSIDLIKYLSVLSFEEFTQNEVERRKQLIEAQKKSGTIEIYKTNDLFNILLVKRINNKNFIILEGEYIEFIE